MQPDLSPHLHTAECNFLIELLNQCRRENTFKKFIGACNYWDEAVWQCTKKERIYHRMTNPKWQKRKVVPQNLPEEMWTPALRKLKAEGSLPDLTGSESGCKI